jgi:glycogen synthase
LRAFYNVTQGDPDTALILRTYDDPFGKGNSESVRHTIADIKEKNKYMKYSDVLLINNMLSESEIMSLHKTCDNFVLPSRGEGWCIPAFDAMAMGSMPIVTKWGGFVEYINYETGHLIDAEMQPCWGMQNQGVYTGYEHWAEPSLNNLIFTMDYVLNIETKVIKDARVKQGKKMSERFSLDKLNYNEVFEKLA